MGKHETSEASVISSLLDANSNLAQLTSIVKQIEDAAVNKYKTRLKEGVNYVELDSVDLLTDKRCNKGLRRYTAKNSEDGFVMVPDKSGFWTPYSDKIKE
jgi:hypothetical protein